MPSAAWQGFCKAVSLVARYVPPPFAKQCVLKPILPGVIFVSWILDLVEMATTVHIIRPLRCIDYVPIFHLMIGIP